MQAAKGVRATVGAQRLANIWWSMKPTPVKEDLKSRTNSTALPRSCSSRPIGSFHQAHIAGLGERRGGVHKDTSKTYRPVSGPKVYGGLWYRWVISEALMIHISHCLIQLPSPCLASWSWKDERRKNRGPFKVLNLHIVGQARASIVCK